MASYAKVVKLVTNFDMRGWHRMRFETARQLKSGECAVFLSADRRKARVIDTSASVHMFYAPKGERYNAALIQRQLGALRLRLNMTHDQRDAMEERSKSRRSKSVRRV